MRLLAALAAAALAGCATGGALRDRARSVAAEVDSAKAQNGETCAPRELAAAEANLRFAEMELDQGNSSRAKEHLDVAQRNARAAAANANCGRVAVLIREPPKIALKDSDGDGVPDADDLCPDVPGPKENQGCPAFADRDKDGVPDDLDRCPDQAGPKENFGCPFPDRDGDGVADRDDDCPDVPGPLENHGCPRQQRLIIVRKDRIELKQQVHFKTNKSIILPSSFELLRQVSQAIKDAPSKTIRIEGHTDNVGKLKKNLRLSQQRADAVKEFLVKQGVEANRLIAIGYGPKRPIASNATRAGKAANRRVEFRIQQTPSPTAPAQKPATPIDPSVAEKPQGPAQPPDPVPTQPQAGSAEPGK